MLLPDLADSCGTNFYYRDLIECGETQAAAGIANVPRQVVTIFRLESRRGRIVCDRLGAAVDFIVDDEDMLEVAQWIAANTSFDRLYSYGSDRQVHVSCGPNHDRQIVRMAPSKWGRRVLRVVRVEDFLGL